jgi:hypothetical protein
MDSINIAPHIQSFTSTSHVDFSSIPENLFLAILNLASTSRFNGNRDRVQNLCHYSVDSLRTILKAFREYQERPPWVKYNNIPFSSQLRKFELIDSIRKAAGAWVIPTLSTINSSTSPTASTTNSSDTHAPLQNMQSRLDSALNSRPVQPKTLTHASMPQYSTPTLYNNTVPFNRLAASTSAMPTLAASFVRQSAPQPVMRTACAPFIPTATPSSQTVITNLLSSSFRSPLFDSIRLASAEFQRHPTSIGMGYSKIMVHLTETHLEQLYIALFYIFLLIVIR